MQEQDSTATAAEPPQTDIYCEHLKKCLMNICRVIQNTNDILCNISHPSVCSEVLLSSRGTDYISEVLEVYRISKRIEGGMRALRVSDDSLWLMLRDIELLWNNLQAFLSLCPYVLQRLPPLSFPVCKSDSRLSDSIQCLQRCCGVCLLGERQDEAGSRDGMLMYRENLYHITCANFWINCVDLNLPVLHCPKICSLCVPEEIQAAQDPTKDI
uniref:Synergin gamma C-terminal domain-containing protein n=1 Tax=Leptobrachium leishanense TaxID=445787 RepID=A0A8C5PZY7_9ANUR